MTTKRRYAHFTSPAEYGHALMNNRGGWTLREILGADYRDSSVPASDQPFTQGDFQQTLEKVARRAQSSSPVSKKK
jgi:hypothetical protein